MRDENEYLDVTKQHFYRCLTFLSINHAKVQLCIFTLVGMYEVCLHDIFVSECWK
jgi:hypothetical protein